MKRLILLFISAVFLFLPGIALADDLLPGGIRNTVSDYFSEVAKEMDQSGFDIKYRDGYFYGNPIWLSPREVNEYGYINFYRDTRVPADFQKILIRSGAKLGENLYRKSYLSSEVNNQLCKLKESLEESGFGFLAKIIGPQVEVDYEKNAFFTNGYVLNETLDINLSTGLAEKNGVRFNWKIRGIKLPKPNIVFNVSPFSLETSYDFSKKEINIKLRERNKTDLQINYRADSSRLSKGKLEATAAVLKTFGTSGQIFLSGHYNLENNDGRIFAVFVLRF